MHATRISALACAATLGSTVLLSCGDDEAIFLSDGNGGDPAIITPQGGDAAGGTPSDNAAGQAPSDGGSAAPGTVGGGEGGGAEGGRGGAPSLPPEGEELSFCVRLSSLSKLSLAVEEAYIDAAIVDCRIAWLVPRRQDLIDMRNELISWNRRFWGCEGVPVRSFPLVWGTPPLSQGDADVAIEIYLAAAKRELSLSPLEAAEMLAALERLAQPLVKDASLEPSQPRCDAPGDGGAGGQGGAASNGGGAPSASGAGGAP